MSNIEEIRFNVPTEANGYRLFPPDMEENPLILFHATSAENLAPIVTDGFKPGKTLTSRSFAKFSSGALAHIMQQRPAGEIVVFAVRFETIDCPGIRNNLSDIHVDDPSIQPEILAYMTIPSTYIFA